MDAKKLILIAAVALFLYGLSEQANDKKTTAGKSVRPAKDGSVKNALQNLLNAGITFATSAASKGENEDARPT